MDSQNTTVLLVEDDKNSAKLLVDLLTAEGYRVVCENTGLGARRRLGEERFDLILLDLRLPEQNGFVIAEYARQNPLSAHVPIIVVSAYIDRQNRLRAYRSGVNIVFSKPIDAAELLLGIANILQVRRPS